MKKNSFCFLLLISLLFASSIAFAAYPGTVDADNPSRFKTRAVTGIHLSTVSGLSDAAPIIVANLAEESEIDTVYVIDKTKSEPVEFKNYNPYDGSGNGIQDNEDGK